MPEGRHFGSQNGAKADPKTTSTFKSAKVASWKRLGSILDLLGGRSGGVFIDFVLVLDISLIF